jgi:hypothetical protein
VEELLELNEEMGMSLRDARPAESGGGGDRAAGARLPKRRRVAAAAAAPRPRPSSVGHLGNSAC